jgi:heme exporter protein B
MFRKELTLGLRFKAAWGAMFMFALTTLACVSLALQGGQLEPELAAALLWIILFFASMAGADRGFADEDTAGTLLTLKLYGGAQPVLWGKMLYSFLQPSRLGRKSS